MQVGALGTVGPLPALHMLCAQTRLRRRLGPPEVVSADVMLIVHADEEILELVANDGEMD